MQMEIETNETRILNCKLTEHELMERGEELAAELKGVAELIRERAAINAQIKPREQAVERLVTVFDTKEEAREVECDWRFDWPKGVKVLYRTDTFEEIERKEITEAERQIQLELNGQED